LYSLPQKLFAEFTGTFTLIFVGAGSICADQYLRAAGQGAVGILGIAAAHGLAIAIMISALGHISGGHFNPAITLGFWVTKKLGTIASFLYWVAQLLGGITGAYLLKLTIPEAIWRPVAMGTPDLASDITRLPAMGLETVMTFLLVFVVFATTVDPEGAFNTIAGFAIGLTISIDILVGGPFTGAAMNPARAFGPALASHHWTNHGVYWIGPLFGGLLAAWIYDSFFLHRS
jgi:MIP family channel proteins